MIKIFKNNNFVENYEVKRITKWLKDFNIRNYTINNDYKVDIDGEVIIYQKKLNLIPIKFGVVNGNFKIVENNLLSLSGSPDKVFGDFWCFNNNLTDLMGSPNYISGNFKCYKNSIISLVGCPEFIGGDFDFTNNKLTDFNYLSVNIGSYNPFNNPYDEIFKKIIQTYDGLTWSDKIKNYLINKKELQNIEFNIDEKNKNIKNRILTLL